MKGELVFQRTYTNKTIMVYSIPNECRCHRMACLFVNSDGSTGCLNCKKEDGYEEHLH